MRRIRCAFCLVIALALALLAARLLRLRTPTSLCTSALIPASSMCITARRTGVGESHSKGIYVSRFHAATGELESSRNLPRKSSILHSSQFLPIIDSFMP